MKLSYEVFFRLLTTQPPKITPEPALSDRRRDAPGNLTKDNKEAITDISWNHSNKIRKITFTAASGKPALEFRYDPMGNRIVKIVKSGENEDEWQYTYYARDASGQTMAVYEKTYIDPMDEK